MSWFRGSRYKERWFGMVGAAELNDGRDIRRQGLREGRTGRRSARAESRDDDKRGPRRPPPMAWPVSRACGRKFLQDNISLVQKVEVVVFLDFALTSESDAMQCGILPNPDRKKWLMTRAKARVRM